MSASEAASTFAFSVRFSAAERDAGVPSSENVERAVDIFATQGFVRLENVFSVETMRVWTEFYERQNRRLLASTDWPNRRPLFTIDVEGPLNTPNLYASPLVMPLVRRAVGEKCIVGALSTVISFPGAPDQYLHRDSEALFGDDYAIDKNIPAYAMTMLIPLVECNRETGCTKVWPGSHLRNDSGEEEAAREAAVEPVVPVGSVLVTDSRLWHRGGANVSTTVRPLVYVSYHRGWFRDFGGYETRRPLSISTRELRRVPAEFVHMFAWTRDPYPKMALRARMRALVPRRLGKTLRSLIAS